MKRAGFTLLEVVVAVALLFIVTGAAMAAYVAQTRIINTQQQTSSANDHTRETIRLLSNDIRAAGAGLNAATAGFPKCAPGTIPFDYGAGAASVACLPPVFRSTSPLYFDNAVAGAAWPVANYTQCVGGAPGAYSPGYRLDLWLRIILPLRRKSVLPRRSRGAGSR